MFTTKRLTAAVAVCLLSGVGVAEAAAAPGDLVQKPGAAGCLSIIGFCDRGAALDGAESITVSPDGTSAYVASPSDDAVAVFDRARDGTLTQKRGPAGCICGVHPTTSVAAMTTKAALTILSRSRPYSARKALTAAAVS